MAAERRPRSPHPGLRALAIAAAFALAACDNPIADAESPSYDPTLNGGDRRIVYHWPLGASIAVFVDTSQQAGRTDLVARVKAADAAWREVMYYREASLRLVSSPADADVIVHLAEAALLVDPPCAQSPGNAGGETFFCVDDELTFIDTLPLATGGGGHVRMDVFVDRQAVSSEAAFQSLVTHEIGHVLGIGSHSPNSADIMSPLPSVAKPSERDASALRYILHRPVDLRL